MKRVEPLIAEVRELTNNTRYDSNSGISQAVMARYLQNGQDEIVKAMVNAKTKLLQKEADPITVVAGQQVYPYPDDIFLQNIETMQWTQDNISFVNMEEGYTKYRFNNRNAYAFGYYTKESGFVMTPPLTNGFIYLNYMRKLPRMAIRSGTISALTVGGGNLTALSVSTTGGTFYNPDQIASDNFLTIVDYLGNIKLKGVGYISESSGVFNIVSTAVGTANLAIGDYIVIGDYACNKSELPDICEGFLIKYAEYQVKYGDASKWSQTVKDDVALALSTLLDAINTKGSDTNQILVTNYDYLNLG